MRNPLAVALAGVYLLTASPAWGDGAAALVTRGEQLAKEGRLSEAIDAFKQADRLQPRARNACLIALAYTRRELWPQAEIFLAQCHQRAGAGDPIPDWVPLADKQLAEKLSSARVAAVKIRVEPSDAKARLVVSSFAPDEAFEPRTIHLSIGKHLITGTAEGYPSAQQTVEITDTSPREVVVRFQKPPPPPPPKKDIEPPPPKKVVVEQPSRLVPWTFLTAGFAVALGGGAYHLFAFRPARDKLFDARMDSALYDSLESDFYKKRNTTLALYGTGAGLVLIGVVLRVTVYKSKPESAVRVSTQPTAGGALVGLEWPL